MISYSPNEEAASVSIRARRIQQKCVRLTPGSGCVLARNSLMRHTTVRL